MMEWRNNTNHPTFKLVKKLAKLRKYNPALRYGNTKFVMGYSGSSFNDLAFVRKYQNNKVFFFHGTSSGGYTINFNNYQVNFPAGEYTDPLTNKKYNVRNGVLNIRTSKPHETVVLVINPSSTPIR